MLVVLLAFYYGCRPANIVKGKIGRNFFIQTKNRKQCEKSVILNIAYPVYK